MLNKTGALFRSTKVALSALFILSSLVVFGQRDSNEYVVSKIDSLLNGSDYSGAQRIALEYLSKSDLSDQERFQFWMIRAEIIRASGRPIEAIHAYEDARSYIPPLENRALILSQIQMRLAECFFDIPEYDEAAFHANESLKISRDTSIANSGHAINYLILGYVDFLKGHYTSSLEYYTYALEYYQMYGYNCDLPLVYTKMARVANALGNSDEAINYINECKLINDSCEFKIYDILTYQTLFEIQKENKRYRDALLTLETLAELKDKMEYTRQSSEMALIEKEYETNLRQAEIKALKLVNEKNEVIKHQQNRFLTFALVGLVALAVLSLLLARVNTHRLRAMKQMEKLNQDLEKEVARRTAHLHEANESIRLQAESITERNIGLTELYHMVSHDLRGPINNLTMLVEFLKAASDETERKQLMDHMNPVLESLNSTANELLEKVDSSTRVENDLRNAYFKSALESAKKGLLVELESSKAEISTNFSNAESVFYSQKYLTSIFYNFLSNALKYAHPERTPKLFVSTIKNDNVILLRFNDNGSGIDMEKNGSKLFQFKEVFSDRSDSKGIGLYMLKMQIERSGGEIWAESTLNSGSNFYVKFNR